MEITIFSKRRETKDGKKFYAYLTTLTRKNGDKLTTSVKFSDACGNPRPEECPLNITFTKNNGNLSVKQFVNPETGESFDSYTLWIKDWKKSDNVWIDHSLDDFE